MNSYLKAIFLLLFLPIMLWSGDPVNPKSMSATRTDADIKIDGILDEEVWRTAYKASGFTQLEPRPGEVASHDSQVSVVYDDKAIFIGAFLKDNQPDSIFTQLSERDDVGVVDWFGVTMDTYQDGLNATAFFVTAAGVQIDSRISDGGSGQNDPLGAGDDNWDAVWESEVQITEEGWAVEMKIPYSALRFSEAEIQNWNLNFCRMIRRFREQSFWSPIDPEGNGFMVQSGKLEGLKDIKSPVRLSATPFLAGYGEVLSDPQTNSKSTGRSFSGGMDIKYGINEAFTLDMTLIPDFGEARSDQQVLNLSPFEVRFNENRQFFTEGTELFNRGGLFYSRRVGGTTTSHAEIEENLLENEIIESNPTTAKLLNATKISGRTKSGLGVGLFNAIEGRTVAQIKNTLTGNTYERQTSALTNFNVLVFNQNLKNNSSISLINTSVLRSGADYDANVTGVEARINNKKNTYRYFISGAGSNKIYTERTDFGHTLSFNLEKTTGQLTWEVGYNEESDTYDPNDLGFLNNNNSRDLFARIGFAQFEDFGIFNAARVNIFSTYQRLYAPDAYMRWRINLFSFMQTKKFFTFGAFANVSPLPSFDYYEPRTADFSKFIRFPAFGSGGFWISTDYRKKVAFDLNVNYGGNQQLAGRYYGVSLFPRLQINDKLIVRPRIGVDFSRNDPGYVTTTEDDIIFGMRNQDVFTTQLNVGYIFGPKMSFNFEGRHYWNRVTYTRFNKLEDDGFLGVTDFNDFSDINFNAFNIDAVFRWRFAPGSEIFFVWKNGIFSHDNILAPSWKENFDILDNSPKRNSFSLKVIYYLDYLALRS